MNAYFPSQIVQYIDRKFPEARTWTGAGNEPFPNVGVEHAPSVGRIATMIERMPDRVMTLRGDDFDEFCEAVESIHLALTLWRGGERTRGIQRIPGRENRHPISIIRRQLAKLSDEGIESTTTDLAFVSDPQFRDTLRRDITSANTALDNGEWKAATVLSGSIIEALLLDAVRIFKASDPSGFSSAVTQCTSGGAISGSVPSNTEKWNLHHLIEIANELSLITPTTTAQCRIAKDFRNLVHPGKAIRTAQTCDRGTAMSAIAGMEHVIRDLSRP